jgi:hypothetical protein
MNRERITLLLLLLLTLVSGASAQLERVGPVDPAYGYPAWYQDRTGLAMEFCTPLNQAELDGGYCLLLPGNTVAPEKYPVTGQFSDEHFYWAADALITFNLPAGGTSKARLVLALEAAFAAGPVIPGDQIVFSRVRVNVPNLPYSGTYTVYHPFGTWTFPNQVAGDRLFFTEDFGICQPGQFDCVLATSTAPFLLPSATPGGPELPAIAGPVPGKLYIADPARIGPLTGSPVGQNFFRIEGPNGFVIQTTDFTMMGRVMTGPIPGRVTINRASYASNTTGNTLDVFATAQPTTQGRLPGSNKPAVVTPVLTFMSAPCGVNATGGYIAPSGATESQMFGNGSVYWGQAAPANVPTGVCVEDYTARDATGQVVPAFFNASVTDQVLISEAAYDPSNGGSLSVKASSTDLVNSPTLTLVGFGNIPTTNLTNGQLLIAPLSAAPAKIQVKSVRGGINEAQVTTNSAVAPSPTIPVAGNDDYVIDEDSGTTNFHVFTNDTLNGAPIVNQAGVQVAITGAPRIGVASVNSDNSIAYTPNPNVNGTDGIAYTVSVNGVLSNVAYITITINPVNDPPAAVNDNTAAVAGRVNSIDVLANDTDPDGAADLLAAVIVPGSVPPQLSNLTVSGGAVSFTPTATGTFTFRYQAKDKGGLLSPLPGATVTVTVSGAEAITITRVNFVVSKKRWRIDGTVSPIAGQMMKITYDNGTLANGTSAAGTLIGTALVDANGTWTLDLPGVTGILDPTNTSVFRSNSLPTRVRVTSTLGASATASIALK